MRGSFVRRRGKTWTAYYYVRTSEGHRRQRSKGSFRTKADAQSYVTSVLATIVAGLYEDAISLTLEDYLEQRWFPIIQHTIRPTTFDSYRRQLRLHVIPKLGGIELPQLRADHLDQLYAELLRDGRADGKEGGLSVKTVRYIHSMIQQGLEGCQAQAAGYPQCRQGCRSTPSSPSRLIGNEHLDRQSAAHLSRRDELPPAQFCVSTCGHHRHAPRRGAGTALGRSRPRAAPPGRAPDGHHYQLRGLDRTA
jgi:hypothetical protein